MRHLRFTFGLLCSALLLLPGCSGCSDHGQPPGNDTDAEVADPPDAEVPFTPDGKRPELSDPAAPVPLLYGRFVEVKDLHGGREAPRIVPLDDPESDAYRDFFGDLERACVAEVSAQLAPPEEGLMIPGCSRDGVFTGLMSACRARAALLFAERDSEHGIAQQAGKAPYIDDGADSKSRLWTCSNDALSVRASFAMYATDALRRAVSSLSKTLDTEACTTIKADDGFVRAPLDELAAEGLHDAVVALRSATSLADSLLEADMRERMQKLPDSIDTRIAVTRGLNYSLLERQKLYAAIPYGAFAPLTEELASSDERAERYPVLYPLPTQEVGASVALFRALSVLPLAEDTFTPATPETLTLRVFDGLRRMQPLVFGAWDSDKAQEALRRIGVTTDNLAQGAAYLTQAWKVLGTAAGKQRSLDQLADIGPHPVLLNERGPLGYELAITEGMASLASDRATFALRGLAHAEQVAARIAAAASDHAGLSANARAQLASLREDGSPPQWAELCVSPREEGGADTQLRLKVAAEDADRVSARYELWFGEAGVTCALTGKVSGLPCDEAEHALAKGEFKAEASELVFAPIAGQEGPKHRVYLTVRNLSSNDSGRTVVAGFSAEPLRTPKREGCGLLPLSADLLRDMRRVHEEDLNGKLPRVAEIEPGDLRFSLADEDIVPLHWARTVRVVDGKGETRTLDLSQPLSQLYGAFVGALAQRCMTPAEPRLSGPFECQAGGFLEAVRHACVAGELFNVAPSRADVRLNALRLVAPTEEEATSLRLLAMSEAELALTALLDVADDNRCKAKDDAEAKLRGELVWPLANALIYQLENNEVALREALLAERDGRWAAEADANTKEVGTIRDLTASSLAAARLYVATALRLYGPRSTATSEALSDALARFPVVTRRAVVAEDTRIESLLRNAALDPRMSDLTLTNGAYDTARMSSRVSDGTLVRRLREALIAADANQTLPTDPNEMLRRLGVSQTQLDAAVLRIVEQSEWRGLSLLAQRSTSPLRASGLSSVQPGPEGAHLFALTEGRARSAASAVFRHVSLRSLFHAWARAANVLGAALLVPADAPSEQSKRRALVDKVRAHLSGESVTLELERTENGPTIALEVSLQQGQTTRDLSAQIELWWTDSGLRCALGGSVAGESCTDKDYRFGSTGVTVENLEAPPRGHAQRVRMSGFSWPEAALWDPLLSDEKSRGRVYVVQREGDKRRVIASVSLESAGVQKTRMTVPDSDALRSALVPLLSYRTPGEGCATCVRRSVCERASCELGVCIRSNVADFTPCTAQGVCMAGACDKPGCGDGARSDGTTDIPFEACDDGNLFNDDGCSATCEPEVRRLEPTLAEGFPAGPSPVVGIDGLGRALIVYMTDALVGESVAIRVAPLDAFGAPARVEQSLESNMPRGYLSKPTVTGLRDGGFVVLYGSPSVEGRAGIAMRFVDALGNAGDAKAIDTSGALQSDPRVVQLGEGFAVVWVEGSQNNYGSRVRMRRFDALGVAQGASLDVAPTLNAVDQKAPALATSLGQLLIVWQEADKITGAVSGLYGRRVDEFGAMVDSNPFFIATGDVAEPSLAVLGTSEYVVAFTDARLDVRGDISARVVQRFGPPLEGSSEISIARTDEAETRPVVAAARGSAFVTGYQLGSPQAYAILSASSVDPESVKIVNAELSHARLRDLSMSSDQRGIWVVWSELLPQSRALFVYRLPLDKAP